RAKYTNNAGTAMYSPILKITPKAAGTQILVPDWATFEKIGNDPFFPLDASYLQTADITAPVGTVYQTKGTLSGGYDGGGFGIDLAGIGKNDWKAKGDDCGLFGIISGSVKNMRLKNATADFGVLNSGILAGTVTGTVNDVAGTNFTITANLPTAGAMSYASGLIGVGKGAVLSNLSIDTLKMDIQGGGNLGGCYTTGLASLIDGSKISGTNRISNANIVLTGNQLVNGQAYGVAILINNTTASGLYIDNSTVMMKGSVDDAYMGGITGVHANSTFTNGEARNVNVISETTGNKYNMNMGGALSFNHVGSRTENVNVIGGQVVNRCTNIARTYMGGFVAEIYQGGVIKNCSTSADVLNVNTAGLIGGFIGRCCSDANSFVKIEGCTANGKISATKNGSIGGFAGEISNSPMNFKNNVTTSKITTQAKNKELYLGGFVGNMGLTGANLVTTTPSAPTDTFYNNMYVESFSDAENAFGTAGIEGLNNAGISALKISDKSISMQAGMTKTVTATPAGGYAFAGWTQKTGTDVASLTYTAGQNTATITGLAGKKGTASFNAKFTKAGAEDIDIPLSANITGDTIYISNWADFEKIGNDPAYPLTGKYIQTCGIAAPTGTTYQTKGAFSGSYDGGGFAIDMAGVAADKWVHTVA
ncbi:MAG: hypothetical protein RR459_08180, partial [Christensenellaceae bacterium]